MLGEIGDAGIRQIATFVVPFIVAIFLRKKQGTLNEGKVQLTSLYQPRILVIISYETPWYQLVLISIFLYFKFYLPSLQNKLY